MTERETEFSGDVIYTEADLTTGLDWARSQLAGFRSDLGSPDELTRSVANQSIPQYEEAIQYAERLSPAEMMAGLKAIFDQAHNLESTGLEPLEIGKRMEEKFGDQITHYRVILRQCPKKGWIKSLGQWVFAAAMASRHDSQ